MTLNWIKQVKKMNEYVHLYMFTYFNVCIYLQNKSPSIEVIYYI